ncbi:efflux RND transporter periplasmic adaptor subunit [Alginatibacterium sediminis]|uniref:Efflux RND transporter periplasmic adaptor subunit n=1 Tax=Alginatibacterium sediminis TaxID=2164068 RepID=A0A420E7K3_9ALTE|nr:efflux RND transporter periplasmic adaptor subunit [Alginatibacterium sediminis]RKF14428.1 efflux RND transporter periplasmic adaptor subunit [Alginatibacterium sediminis]
MLSKRLARKFTPVILLSPLLLLSACEDKAVVEAPPLAAVSVKTVTVQTVTPSHEFVGRTVATQDVEIKSQVSGNLIDRHFDEGTQINKGDLLFSIDPAQYQAQLNQSLAALEQSKAAAETARINWARGDKLVKDGYISQTDYDKLTSNKIQSAAAVSSAEAIVSSAELDLSYTKIYAPISGRIGRSTAFSGDLISPGQNILTTIVQLDPIWVNFQIPETLLFRDKPTKAEELSDAEIADLFESLKIRMRFPSGAEYDQTGTLDFLDNRIGATTGTLDLRAVFDNERADILPGLYVTAIVEEPNPSEVMLIGQSSVQEDQQGRYVMTVNDENIVERKNVDLGNRYGVDWEVKSGLEVGDKVISNGIQKVRAGVEVQWELDEADPFGTTPATSASDANSTQGG